MRSSCKNQRGWRLSCGTTLRGWERLMSATLFAFSATRNSAVQAKAGRLISGTISCVVSKEPTTTVCIWVHVSLGFWYAPNNKFSCNFFFLLAGFLAYKFCENYLLMHNYEHGQSHIYKTVSEMHVSWIVVFLVCNESVFINLYK